MPDDAPEAKLTQIRAYGAHVVRVRGMMDGPHQWYAIVRRLQALADSVSDAALARLGGR